ncbi:crossover junction endodeoxyribonuclease RuvC [Thiohalomonas denitrificans]|uniref:Crossover junction endodeoxyribonuclease RuvC n=1 Tax=Thiohalomonas denitrificans TaxID=415747 RepID=A0A1G5PKR0_9GAMM|nr:crossover junction endodeoxyribonuclease RuvC [Thiohalomonas denitrificans]SCZ50125.1 Holliday junction endonuclease RuvC [Thiohalomonas denitrificans]
MRILGIDPGSRITGFGIIERVGGRVAYVESGCIRAGTGEFSGRLKVIFDSVRDVVAIYRPEQVAVERVFMHKNPDSALKLGHARGAALCALMMEGLKVSEYTPAEIKQATVGKGNATKAQVQHMIQALLKLPGIPREDAADALAVALCHLHTGQTLGRINRSAALTGGRRR